MNIPCFCPVSRIQYQSISRNGRPYKKAKLSAKTGVRGKMEFLKKRQINDFGESREETGLAFLDLTYTHSNNIFHLLAREGLVQDDSSSQSLASFLEVVSFVHCWIEMEVERRLSGQALKSAGGFFIDIKNSWGSFFAHAPDEPKLENASVESVHAFMKRRCSQYHASYVSSLDKHGRLHAERRCYAAFLENILSGHPSSLEDSGKGQEGTTNLNDPILHYIGETIYELDRDINLILTEHAL
jgi:hypothetical protein